MTHDKARKKSESRMTKRMQLSVWLGFRHWAIDSDLVIRSVGFDNAVSSIHEARHMLRDGGALYGPSFAQAGGSFSRYSVSPAFGTSRTPSLSRAAKSSIRTVLGSR